MDKPGFNIGDDFYPFPTNFRLGDPVLVTEVTGMEWNDFAELLDGGDGDPRTMTGLIAVAVWQKHPGWRRERALRYVEGLDLESLTFKQPEEAESADPPTEAGDTATTAVSPATSTPTREQQAPSDETPASTGARLSAIS